MASAHSNVWLWILLAVCMLNCFITFRHIANRFHPTEKQYSYIGQDYPVHLPIPKLPQAEVTLQESIRYSLNTTEGDDSWNALSTHPYGYGWVRLGPNSRVMDVGIWHQLHCTRQIQRALLNRSHPISNPAHIQHCINYWRQRILCQAVDTLEKGDFMARDHAVNRVGDTVQCKDWETLYDWTANNFAEWLTQPGAQW